MASPCEVCGFGVLRLVRQVVANPATACHWFRAVEPIISVGHPCLALFAGLGCRVAIELSRRVSESRLLFPYHVTILSHLLGVVNSFHGQFVLMLLNNWLFSSTTEPCHLSLSAEALCC